MHTETTMRAAAAAALLAFIGLIIILLNAFFPDASIQVQPSTPSGPVSEFVRATNLYPQQVLRAFAGDSLFILGYAVVFIGLHAVTAPQSRPLALLGLNASLLAASLDAGENAFFITYALLAQSGVPLTEPDLPLIYIFANLKWMTAFAGVLAFALAFPRKSGLEWIIFVLLLSFPLVGVAGFAFPALEPLRLLPFLIGMPLLAFYFWKRLRP